MSNTSCTLSHLEVNQIVYGLPLNVWLKSPAASVSGLSWILYDNGKQVQGPGSFSTLCESGVYTLASPGISLPDLKESYTLKVFSSDGSAFGNDSIQILPS